MILCLLESSTVAGAAFANKAERSAERMSLLFSILTSGRAEIQEFQNNPPARVFIRKGLASDEPCVFCSEDAICEEASGVRNRKRQANIVNHA